MSNDVMQLKVLSLLDLTSLNDSDDRGTIDQLCKKAIVPQGHVAAVCVYPRFVKQVAEYFLGSPVKIATVVNFPHGTDSLDSVLNSIQQVIHHGANEIDVVFPYRQFLSGNKDAAYEFIQACKMKCGKDILLKVILETGELKDISIITEVSQGVLMVGADFLKTSTGKVAIGATPEVAIAMLNVIKEKTIELNRSIGFKASGGIRTMEQATHYINLASQIMGHDWVIPEHFRLGTSQLIN